MGVPTGGSHALDKEMNLEGKRIKQKKKMVTGVMHTSSTVVLHKHKMEGPLTSFD